MTIRLRRGKLEVDVHFRHANGTSQRVQKVVPTQTKKAALRYEKQVLHALSTGTYRAPKLDCPTVEGFEAEVLKFAETNQKASNVKSKRDALRKHIRPLLGGKRLVDVGTKDVEKLKRHLQGLELAPKTINNVVSVLSSMLRLAENYGHVTKRPHITWMKVRQHEEPPLSREDFERLVAAAEPEWRTMMRFAVMTGLRLGELCDVRWSNVDLDGHWVRVRQAVYRGESDSPKHGKTRDVPLHAELVPLLKALRRPGVVYVFTTAKGAQLDPYNQPTVGMQRASRRSGLGRDCGWHLLRHTWASWLGAAGVPAKTLMTLGGWSSLSMVSRYVNLSGEDLTGAIARLGVSTAPGAREGSITP